MIGPKSVSVTVALAMASMVAAGCATTQSESFRHMSAADHEAAARSASEPDAAQEHLAAARKLRDEEQFACVNVPDADRQQGPLANPDRIAGVEVVKDKDPVYPKAPERAAGIAVYVRAEPGMTEQWLGRVLECHLAHVAVVGSAAGSSPLAVEDARVAVSSTPVGFRVTITSKDSETVRSLVQKGQILAGNSSLKLASE
jgi:hypothetical protein